MSLETRPFDPARYLDSDEACAAYMTEALETHDPAFILDALEVVARARREQVDRTDSPRNKTPALAVDGDGQPALITVLRMFRDLGLRLTARPLAS